MTANISDEILGELAKRAQSDTNWRGGRVFSLVYHAGAEHEDLVAKAHKLYASANLLNPMAFPSLKQLEKELVEWAGALMHGKPAGVVTSGGTESILCAVAAYRDRARRERPWASFLGKPELVVPTTIHPAFDKAAHYFDVKLVKVPIGDDLRAVPARMEKAIGRRTIGMVASAPQYPHGVVDPIGQIGAIAKKHGLPMHVDACVGGFILPWLEKLGRDVPAWDFRVPGVTSISADLHKYGYAGKGASLLLWRHPELIRDQIFVATDFPGGIYASPTMIGTRPGGPIAAAWAATKSLTASGGYLELARTAAETADRLRGGIARIPGLVVLGRAEAPIVAFSGTGVDVFVIADRLEERGWTVDRMHRPNAIHLTVTANHAQIVEPYLADLAACVAEVRSNPGLKKSGTAPMYGMAAKMPVRGLVARNVRKVIAEMYK